MTRKSFTPDRRIFLAGTAATLIMPAFANAEAADVKLYVGTYSSDTAKGIYPLTYTATTDSWTLGSAMPAIENASFGAYSPASKHYYLLNEKDEGRVGVYDQSWTQAYEVSSQGNSPCYAAVDSTGGYLAVANYSSGNIVVYKIGAEGGLEQPPTIRQNTGTGPNKDRQEGPHAHWVQFHGDHIYSVDLGTDQVLGYSFNAATGAVGQAFEAFKAPAGAGTRHMVFHPDGVHAFLVTEMGNTVIALRKTNNRFETIQTLSTLPEGFTGHSQAAHIVLNGAVDRLYVSNRGHNSIVVFDVGKDGTLSLKQIAPTLGDWPRFFLLLEAQKRVVVAHQNGNDLIVFEVKADGTLAPKDQKIAVSKPVFIGAVA
ncbi:lactonase family protein [Asticcacaulis sp.]|uniref:lactonase family protein n=1 Tax=Asticcacaulis sp. TaxID=1872648 RepID=UPI002C0F6ADF|nr:lactonase family protein [Asticcacaulis sp.]HTM83133.1 lactonase family protein [Asticcacaulis sp.]